MLNKKTPHGAAGCGTIPEGMKPTAPQGASYRLAVPRAVHLLILLAIITESFCHVNPEARPADTPPSSKPNVYAMALAILADRYITRHRLRYPVASHDRLSVCNGSSGLVPRLYIRQDAIRCTNNKIHRPTHPTFLTD